ncbi:MAG TPA: ABC transporter substrate-binding protein [Limnochordia bacterium]|nr:ABC transporter substrate-binding protein [Limnochordia bacterium]
MKRRLGASGLVLAGMLGLAQFAHAAEVKLGTLMALTGDLASYGTVIQRASDLAAEQINLQGGLLSGSTLSIVHRDAATDPKVGVDAAQKLVSIDHVSGIVGALSSGVTLAVASSVAVPNHVLLISPASTSPTLTDLKDDGYVYRTVPSDAFQSVVLAQVAAEQGFKKLAVLYVNNAYGDGLAKAFAAAFAKQGGQVTGSAAFEEKQPTYQADLDKLAKGNPDGLVLISYPESGITILKDALEGGSFSKFLFSDGMKSDDIIAAIGAQYLNGTYGTAAKAVPNPSTSSFEDAYKQRFGELPPKPYMNEAYDATFVLAMAIEKAGTASDSAAIRDAIPAVTDPNGELIRAGEWSKARRLIDQGKHIHYVGAAGPIVFDQNGDMAAGSIGVWQIADGKIVDPVKIVQVGG